MLTTQSHISFSLLIVEDDKAVLNIIVRMVSLRFPDWAVHFAENGKRGLELFKEHTPEIVITDINMPEMDGIEMAREIRTINGNTTCIVMTAYSDKNYLEKFTEIGYCAYLMKPVDFNELFAVIERCSTESKLQSRSGPDHLAPRQ